LLRDLGDAHPVSDHRDHPALSTRQRYVVPFIATRRMPARPGVKQSAQRATEIGRRQAFGQTGVVSENGK